MELDGVMEVVPVGLWISRDPNLEIIEGNAEALRQLRIPPESEVSLSTTGGQGPHHFEVWVDGKLVAPQDLPMPTAAREGRTFHDVEEEVRFDDGTRMTLRVSCVPLFDDEGRPAGMVASSVDLSRARSPRARTSNNDGRRVEEAHAEPGASRRISELRETYDRVRDFERLALTGTIAAGLGHDLGNLLLPLRLRLDALRRITLPDEAQTDIAAIELAVNYLQQLSTGLRWLAADSGTGTDSAARTRLSGWIHEAEQGFRDALPPGVKLTVDVPAGLPVIRISRVALTQVVYNLVQNAGQALRGRKDAQIHLSAQTTPEGDSVLILVTDNGPGLDEEGRARCFEPFFSTKKRQISTGLGLAIVRSLVRRAGGEATVSSDAGAGATFTITIPVARADVDTSVQAERACAVITVSGERRQALVRTILTHDGFEIVDVEDASEVGSGVWVSDLEPPGTLDDLRSFVEASSRHWALVIGRPDDQFDHSRIVNAGAFEDIPAFRAALEYVPQPPASEGASTDANG